MVSAGQADSLWETAAMQPALVLVLGRVHLVAELVGQAELRLEAEVRRAVFPCCRALRCSHQMLLGSRVSRNACAQGVMMSRGGADWNYFVR